MLKLSPDTGLVTDIQINNTVSHLKNLIECIPWQQGFTTRKVCNIGCDYTYSGRTVKGYPFSVYNPLEQLIIKINNHLGTNFNSILLNWYPKGSSVGIGFHKDDEPELVPGSKVASLSLGCTTSFTIKNSNESITVELNDGDLFVMGSNCQKYYNHGIPKKVMSSDRISLTFREFITTEESKIPTTDPVFNTTTSPTNSNDFTNHTGGAYGIDTLGDIIGREFGFNNHFHYRPYDNPNMSASLRKSGVRSHLLTRAETDHGRNSINRLLNKQYTDNIAGNLQGRNYYQVTNARAVYCFGKMLTPSSIKGGTNTAFQLALVQNKPLYLYDVEVFGWYQYNYITRQLESMENSTPILTKDYSIVGTRDIEDYHVKDRVTGKWGSRPQYLGNQTAQVVCEAMRDLYKSTINALSV